MELEQPSIASTIIRSGPRSSPTLSHDHPCDLLGQPCSLLRALEMGLPMDLQSPTAKLAWLRGNLIGKDAEFDTPFGRRRITYADSTATGRCLCYVENFITNHVLPFYGNTHTCDSYVGQQTTKMTDEASKYVKTCLGGSDDVSLLFCGSGTTAAIKRLQEVTGIAVPSTLRERVLQILRKEERWVVFVGPYEHHSNCLSWRQSLAEVVEIGLTEEGQIDMEALRLHLEHYQPTKRPMLGSFSACSNVTGICSDTRAIASLLHQYGAFACFDFAASGPYVEIDMRSGEIDSYDAVSLSPHKFLGGPGSPGILLMSKALYQLGSSPPSTCGGGTVNFVNGYSEKDTLYLEDIEERENAGTPPIIGKIRAAMAFWLKAYTGYQVIEKQEAYYIQRAMERLAMNENIWVLGNTNVKRQTILSFLVYSSIKNCSSADENPKDFIDRIDEGNNRLHMWEENGGKRSKPLHGPFIAKLLNDLFGIQARGGCACAGPYAHSLLNISHQHSLALKSYVEKGYIGAKPGWARVSFPFYMSNEEFEFTLSALEFVAAFGQRFLPLYDFNWETGNWTFKKSKFQMALPEKEAKCSFCSSRLIGCSRSTSLDSSRLGKGSYAESEDVALIQKYASYLENAKQIAHLLPKFPAERTVPKDIDPSLLLFRI